MTKIMAKRKFLSVAKISLALFGLSLLVVSFQNCSTPVNFRYEGKNSEVATVDESAPTTPPVPATEPTSMPLPEPEIAGDLIFEVQIGNVQIPEQVVTDELVFAGGYEGFLLLN